MRHQQQGAGPVAQQLLQPLDGVDVEVVGRLVEQQHVGRRDQRLRQGHPLARAAGQRVDDRGSVEVQSLQGLIDALLPGPAAQRFEPRLQGVQIVVGSVRLVARAQPARLGHAFGDGVEHRHARRERRLLRDVDAARAALHLQQAIVELLQARQDLQQRGLAGAVAPDQR